MTDTTSDHVIDQLVWSIIKDSENPNDFVSFVRHARDREVDYDAAFTLALKHRAKVDAKSLFPDAVAKLHERASAGCSRCNASPRDLAQARLRSSCGLRQRSSLVQGRYGTHGRTLFYGIRNRDHALRPGHCKAPLP